MSKEEVSFDMLDGTVDSLADLKAFEPFPAGSYKLQIGWDKKPINDMPAVILKLKCMEVLELADASQAPPAVDATVDIAFLLKRKDKKQNNEVVKNEIGEGQLKEVIKVLAPVFQGNSVAEVMAASEGAIVLATLKVRQDKNDEDRKYNQIKTIELAA